MRLLSTLNKFTMLYYAFYNKYSISRYNMMTNYKTKKAGGNPRVALWPENLGKNQNVFFFQVFSIKVGTIYRC